MQYISSDGAISPFNNFIKQAKGGDCHLSNFKLKMSVNCIKIPKNEVFQIRDLTKIISYTTSKLIFNYQMHSDSDKSVTMQLKSINLN